MSVLDDQLVQVGIDPRAGETGTVAVPGLQPELDNLPLFVQPLKVDYGKLVQVGMEPRARARVGSQHRTSLRCSNNSSTHTWPRYLECFNHQSP